MVGGDGQLDVLDLAAAALVQGGEGVLRGGELQNECVVGVEDVAGFFVDLLVGAQDGGDERVAVLGFGGAGSGLGFGGTVESRAAASERVEGGWSALGAYTVRVSSCLACTVCKRGNIRTSWASHTTRLHKPRPPHGTHCLPAPRIPVAHEAALHANPRRILVCRSHAFLAIIASIVIRVLVAVGLVQPVLLFLAHLYRRRRLLVQQDGVGSGEAAAVDVQAELGGQVHQAEGLLLGGGQWLRLGVEEVLRL